MWSVKISVSRKSEISQIKDTDTDTNTSESHICTAICYGYRYGDICTDIFHLQNRKTQKKWFDMNSSNSAPRAYKSVAQNKCRHTHERACRLDSRPPKPLHIFFSPRFTLPGRALDNVCHDWGRRYSLGGPPRGS